jgi:hypothetical protein
MFNANGRLRVLQCRRPNMVVVKDSYDSRVAPRFVAFELDKRFRSTRARFERGREGRAATEVLAVEEFIGRVGKRGGLIDVKDNLCARERRAGSSA